MKTTYSVLVASILLGLVFIGIGQNFASQKLPGNPATLFDHVTAGLYGPCATNGVLCPGNRVCMYESIGSGGTCVGLSGGAGTKGGDACGSCTGTDEHKVCKGTDIYSSCTESTDTCCDVDSECHTSNNVTKPCNCQQSGNLNKIGTRIKCST